MANVKLIFHGTENTNTHNTELECFVNVKNQITLSIDSGDGFYPTIICLDTPTAIKFAKTLRSVINEVKEVNNGR